MSEPARKFINRSTRYFYTEDDNNYIAFSAKNKSKTYSAKLLNISGSGLAMVVSRTLCPDENSVINFECTLPNGEDFAWAGRVRRILDFKPDESWATSISDDHIGLKMVGIQFEDFTPEQEQILSKKLDNHFIALKKTEIKENLFLTENWKKIALILVCGAVIYGCFKALSSMESKPMPPIGIESSLNPTD